MNALREYKRYAVPEQSGLTGNLTTPRRGRGISYPWVEWFTKGEFTLQRGIDFFGRTDTMLQQIRNQAGPKRYNVGVSIQVSEDGRIIKVTVCDKRGN